MRWIEIFVRRPVLSVMVVTAMVVLGATSFRSLEIALLPEIDIPVVSIVTVAPGYTADEVETQVTKVIEDSVNSVDGIDRMDSTSLDNVSVIFVEFFLEKKGDAAVQDVRDKVARAVADLPPDAEPPVVSKYSFSSLPIMNVAVHGPFPPAALTNFARHRIKENLENVSGVGEVDIYGDVERAVNVDIDPVKMRGQNIVLPQVIEALKKQNLEIPGGKVASPGKEWVLKTQGRVGKPSDLADIVVASYGGLPTRLGAVAEVEDGFKDLESISRYNGSSAVVLAVRKQPGQNTVKVSDAVFERLDGIRGLLPPGLRVEVVRQQAQLVRSSVHEVEKHLLIGSLLASLVVLLFMGSLRSTLIAAVAIPASIISSFTFIRLMGYSLNTVTLLSLTICVGIVIDDAIVILENIYRYIETRSMDPAAAAVEATREISLAVTATTLSLVVIFVPLAFMTGLVGRFFSSYGATCAVAVLLSMVVSFVLTPMLCAKLLRKPPAGAAAAPRENPLARQSRRLADGYGRLVAWSLRHRAAVVAAALLAFLSTFPILRWVKVEFVPYNDQGEFELDITAPEGTSLQAMDEAVRAVEAELRSIPEVEAVLTTVGDKREKRTNRAEVYVRLVDASQRGASIFEVLDGLRERLATFSRLKIGVRVLSAMNEVGLRASDLVFYLHGPDLARLRQYSDVYMKRMRQHGGLADVTSSLSEEKPQVVTVIDRDKASDRHLSAYDIAMNLRFLVGGEKVSQYKEGGELFDIYVRAKKEYRDDIKALAGLPIYNGQNAILSMGDVCDFKETKGIVQIERLNRQRSVTISANLSGLALADAVAFVEEVKKDLGTGPEYQIKFFGLGKFLQEAIPAMALAFLLSFLFMYMILAAQFDSYLYPLIILLTLPLTLPFALLSLLIFGTTLNLFSAFGLFLLFGIVKKNAILQVDYTNTLIRQGVARDEAIIRANRDRFRPIVMTTITLVAGMIPLVFSTGVGGALRSTMAYVIIGGQAMCLLLTLLIIPVAYSLADDLRRGALFRRRRATSSSAV